MKGVVFTEFFDMVEATFTADMVDDLIDATQPASGGAYTAVGTYDHAEIVDMVVELSARTGVAVPQLLRAFGSYLFGRFHELYPGFFEGVTTSLQFLSSIENVIHVEVLKLYPDAELPRFEIEQHDATSMSMTYRSPRNMGDLAEGLIAGCVDHYDEQVTVDRLDSDDGSVTFRLQMVS